MKVNQPFNSSYERDTIMAGDYVLLIENAGTVRTTSKGSSVSDYVMRGPAAFFGLLNNNGRIYEAGDYLPHLTSLQDKIKTRGLMGELDHPKEFETSLNRVSHVIEKLEYDQPSNSVNIQIRLADTPYGKIAKALIDAGVTLSISSRAAGSVTESNKVRLKKIFTYDLVADPGFEQAQVKRIYESGGAAVEQDTKSVTDTLALVNESMGLGDSTSIKIYKVPSTNESFAKAIGEHPTSHTQATDNRNQMTNYVTVEEMDDYSKLILKQISSLREQVETMAQPPQETPANETRVERLEKYVKYLAEQLDKSITYSGYLAENLDGVIEYSKYLAENLDNSISYGEYIAEQVDNSIAYGEYIAEQVDNVIKYGDYLAEQLDKSIDYSEYLGETLEQTIDYSEYVAEHVDNSISYGEYLAEHIKNTIAYSEYLAENLDQGIAYAEYLAEKTETVIAYGDYLAEQIEIAGEQINESTAAKKAKDIQKNINESAKSIVSEEISFNDRIDRLIDAASKKKAVATADHHFFRFLSEGKRAEFGKLDETAKEKVIDALKDKAYFNESQVVSKWNSALAKKPEAAAPNYIQHMPDQIRPLYEALSEQQKKEIEAQSKIYKLDTPYQINAFWTSRIQINRDSIGLIKLTESEQKPEKQPAKLDPHIQNLANAIGKRFKK